jgi:hypothetical protein
MATRTPQDTEMYRISDMLNRAEDLLSEALKQARNNKWKGATGEKILEKKLKLAQEFVNKFYK